MDGSLVALAVQIHNDSGLSVTDVFTTENPASPNRSPRTHRRSSQRSECLRRRHMPHPEPRLDGSLADGRRSVSRQSRALSQQTSAHRKPCLDDAVALAHRRNAQRSECPCRGHIHIGCAATENRAFTTHRANSQQAESLRGSRAHVEAVYKRKASCSQSREIPRHPPVCPKAAHLPRVRVPLRFRAGTHRQKAQRFESLRRRPVHTRAADVLHHANPIHRRNADSQGQSRGTDTTAKRARRSRAYGPSSRYARIVRT